MNMLVITTVLVVMVIITILYSVQCYYAIKERHRLKQLQRVLLFIEQIEDIGKRKKQTDSEDMNKKLYRIM